MAKTQRYQFPLNNGAYGFPTSKPAPQRKRRRKPWILACVHITGNRNTARMRVGIGDGTGTRAEVSYMARPGNPGGNSAHSYVARNGDMLDCIPWDTYAAWNNGDILAGRGPAYLAKPNTKLASVRKIISLLGRQGSRYFIRDTFNPNEAFWWEVECTGARTDGLGLTDEQITTVATRIARISIKTGLGISRNTVLIHADIDGIDRLGCPWPAHLRERKQLELVKLAQKIKRQLTEPEPEPEPEDPEVPPDVAELQRQLEVANGRADDAEQRLEGKVRALGAIDNIVDKELEGEE